MPSSHLILCRPLLLLPQSLPASGSFQMSQLLASGDQSIGVSSSTSVLPMNTQDWSPLGWTDWISLLSKGLSRVFSSSIVQKLSIKKSQALKKELFTPFKHLKRNYIQPLWSVFLLSEPMYLYRCIYSFLFFWFCKCKVIYYFKWTYELCPFAILWGIKKWTWDWPCMQSERRRRNKNSFFFF